MTSNPSFNPSSESPFLQTGLPTIGQDSQYPSLAPTKQNPSPNNERPSNSPAIIGGSMAAVALVAGAWILKKIFRKGQPVVPEENRRNGSRSSDYER